MLSIRKSGIFCFAFLLTPGNNHVERGRVRLLLETDRGIVMQVAARELQSLHFDAMPTCWNAEDQALLTILLLPDPPEAFATSQDMELEATSFSQEAKETTRMTETMQEKRNKEVAKGKLSAMERRERHREVVKRAYHRNKATLKSLRETVKELEARLDNLSLSKQQGPTFATSQRPTRGAIEQRYEFLTTEKKKLGEEAARLRLLLEYRHHFATKIVAFAHKATSIASDDSDNSDTDSDTRTASSTGSRLAETPSSPPMSFKIQSPSSMLAMDCAVSPMSATQKTKPSFYNEPRPTEPGTASAGKPTLAVAMRKQLGYKPLTLSESTVLVNEMYRSILSFSLCGKAISTGASVLGWEDKRLLHGTSLKFSLRKQFPGQDPLLLMTNTWQCFSDPDCTESKFRGLMTLRILQRVNDDMIVALRESQSQDEDATMYRCVYLLFRVRTRKGFLICVQSVAPERVTDVALSGMSRDGQHVQWTEISGWFVFEPMAARDQEGTRVEYGGCMDFGDHKSVATLAMNTLSIVLKWESMMVSPLFTLPPSSW
ncbi:hypothetical protein PsorP6_003451 [Peronosclerospora sorghi]|uniref:Uncharacterized protein n=1 Tax=Peronosclerospora sorghi TaxID=230839 RepID=A0ACC0VN02_9STRA|nr:hypothetical protein PsorP6_003451 [Peronosclerospora sorghi]